MRSIQVIDSHTGGEPTRLVVSGGPDLGSGSVLDQLAILKQEDWLRRCTVNEPRGNDVLVGAILTPTLRPECHAGLIFFNNVGYLGMCGHGTIGVVATLAHQGVLSPGVVSFDTVVGVVSATLHPDGSVSVANVPSYRAQKRLAVQVDGVGQIHGDLAWAGNWFFLVKDHGLDLVLANVDALTDLAWKIRQAVNSQGYPEVDHIELFGPPASGGDARNFVLCPGKAYDRSPCGTGTCAKLACLAADGELAPGEIWRQESIVGSVFHGSYVWGQENQILPTVTGRAFVMAEASLLLHEEDPFKLGL
jgi:4-hydroxyproline epimerase